MRNEAGIRNVSWCRFVSPLLVSAGTIALSAPASAVEQSAARIPGAVSAANGFGLTASGEILYDSNVIRGATGLNNSGRSRDDVRYSPALSATYGRNTGRISLGVQALIGRDYFQNNKFLARSRYSGGGSLGYRAGSSCQTGITGSYSSRQNGIRSTTALIDPAGGPPEDVGVLIDNVQSVSLYGANFGCGSPTGKLTFGGNYAHTALANASARRSFADSDSDSFSGNIGLGILRPGQVSLTGSYSTIAYPNRLNGFPGINIPPQLLNAGVKTYRVGISVSRPIGTRLSGSIGASFLHANPSGGQAPYSSPAYNLGLNYIASPRLSFGVNGSRDIIASTTSGALFRVVDVIALNAHYSLGRAITIDANAGFINNNYKQSFSIPGEIARRNEATKSFGLGVTYAPRALYDVTLNVSQTVRTSDPALLNYNSTRAGITFAVHI